MFTRPSLSFVVLYQEILPSNAKLKNVMSGQISNLGEYIKVGPKSALIVEVN